MFPAPWRQEQGPLGGVELGGVLALAVGAIGAVGAAIAADLFELVLDGLGGEVYVLRLADLGRVAGTKIECVIPMHARKAPEPAQIEQLALQSTQECVRWNLEGGSINVTRGEKRSPGTATQAPVRT